MRQSTGLYLQAPRGEQGDGSKRGQAQLRRTAAEEVLANAAAYIFPADVCQNVTRLRLSGTLGGLEPVWPRFMSSLEHVTELHLDSALDYTFLSQLLSPNVLPRLTKLTVQSLDIKTRELGQRQCQWVTLVILQGWADGCVCLDTLCMLPVPGNGRKLTLEVSEGSRFICYPTDEVRGVYGRQPDFTSHNFSHLFKFEHTQHGTCPSLFASPCAPL